MHCLQGNISRQEAVSMIPPLLLDVRSNSRVCLSILSLYHITSILFTVHFGNSVSIYCLVNWP